MHPLFGRLSITRGVSLLKESGVYRQVDGPSAEEIANADITYLGGHVYEIDAGEAEPADWQVSGTDTTAALQQPGAIGLISYLSGSSATPTALLSVDTFRAEGPAVETIALDGFGRSLASGWGSAEVGGAWTHQGGSASFSVSDGQGRIALNISDTRASRLLSVATDDGVGGPDRCGLLRLGDRPAGRVGHVLGSAAVRGERGGPALYVAQRVGVDQFLRVARCGVCAGGAADGPGAGDRDDPDGRFGQGVAGLGGRGTDGGRVWELDSYLTPHRAPADAAQPSSWWERRPPHPRPQQPKVHRNPIPPRRFERNYRASAAR